MKYEAKSWEERQWREIIRTVGLLNTHAGSKHTNTTSALSYPPNLSLETIMVVRVLWIGLMNLSYKEEKSQLFMIWLDSSERHWLPPRLKWEEGKKAWENIACIHDSCPVKTMWWTVVQQHREMTQGQRNETRNPCAGVDVSRESMGYRERVDLADGGGVGGVWHCKDVLWWGVGCQEYYEFFFVFLEPHAWFCTEVKCHAEEMNSTCHSYGLGEKLWAFAMRNINAVVYFMLYFK